jgi:hypothetical protein
MLLVIIAETESGGVVRWSEWFGDVGVAKAILSLSNAFIVCLLVYAMRAKKQDIQQLKQAVDELSEAVDRRKSYERSR